MSDTTGDDAGLLSLSPEEQWVLHHVLQQRIDCEHRHSSKEPPPIEVFSAFDKIDSGRTMFTTTELCHVHTQLVHRLEAGNVPESDRRAIKAILEQLTNVLGGPQQLQRG